MGGYMSATCCTKDRDIAIELLANKNYLKDSIIFKSILKTNSSDEISIFGLGVAYHFLNDHTRSLEYIKRAANLGLAEAIVYLEEIKKQSTNDSTGSKLLKDNEANSTTTYFNHRKHQSSTPTEMENNYRNMYTKTNHAFFKNIFNHANSREFFEQPNSSITLQCLSIAALLIGIYISQFFSLPTGSLCLVAVCIGLLAYKMRVFYDKNFDLHSTIRLDLIKTASNNNSIVEYLESELSEKSKPRLPIYLSITVAALGFYTLSNSSSLFATLICSCLLFISFYGIAISSSDFKILQFQYLSTKLMLTSEELRALIKNYASIKNFEILFPDLMRDQDNILTYPEDVIDSLDINVSLLRKIQNNAQIALNKRQELKIKQEKQQQIEQDRIDRQEKQRLREIALSRNAYKNGKIVCPNCGSESITAVKKGFSGGQAAAGAILLGPLGLLAGFGGSDEVEKLCLNCNHRWG